MSNQQIVSTLHIGLSTDRKLPGMDSQNIDNLVIDNVDDSATISDPKSFILLPGGSITIAFITQTMKLLGIKSDTPVNIKFGVGGNIFSGLTFFVTDANAQSLGSLVVTNPDAVNTANVQISEIGA